MLGRKGKSIFAQQQQQMPAGGVDYAAMQPGLGQQQPQGVDWKNLAGQFIGTLGDSIAGDSGGAPVFRQMMAQRAQAEQQAQQMRAQADAKAQERSYGREDWLFKQKYQAENPAPTGLERNVDAYMQFDPEQRQAYEAMNPEPNVVVPIPGRGTYVGPNSGLGAAFGQAPTKPVGKLTPVETTIENTPAPQLGPTGLPATLTRDQYQAVVNARGAKATQEWAQRHGIRVVN